MHSILCKYSNFILFFKGKEETLLLGNSNPLRPKMRTIFPKGLVGGSWAPAAVGSSGCGS